MMYNLLVEQLFFDLRHAGEISENEAGRQVYESGAAGQSALIKLSISFDQLNCMTKVRFKAYGNPYLLAAMEWLCRQLEGRNVQDCEKLEWQRLIALFDMPKTQQGLALRIVDLYDKVRGKSDE